MERTNEAIRVMMLLKANRHRLTRQQIRTIKGQALAGDTAGAMRGLQKLLDMKTTTKRSDRHESSQRKANSCLH